MQGIDVKKIVSGRPTEYDGATIIPTEYLNYKMLVLQSG